MSKLIEDSTAGTPVIICGAPRSGTTFLTTILNSHPEIMITNEIRCWSIFNEVRRRTESPTQALPEHPLRAQFRTALLESFSSLFRDFYKNQVTKDNLGCPVEQTNRAPVAIKAFGDKNPGYADPNQPGCLDFIADAMPDSKFIHMHRDPRSCVASYLSVAVYSDEVDRCIDIWKRHLTSMMDLRDTLGPERVLEISYEHFVTKAGEAILRAIEQHLGVAPSIEPIAFLGRERSAPVPYRSPSTPLDRIGQRTFPDRLEKDVVRRIEESCAPLMERYGYEPIES